jgi:ketosteroid isomerase-like protein
LAQPIGLGYFSPHDHYRRETMNQIAAVEAFVEAFNARDVDTIMGFFTP